jgi:hypothetical protein
MRAPASTNFLLGLVRVARSRLDGAELARRLIPRDRFAGCDQ